MKNWVWILLVSAAFAKHEEYAGWKSYFVAPTTQEQLEFLGSIRDVLDLDYLSYATVDRNGLVLVKPEHQEEFISTLNNQGINYRVHAEDVKKQLDNDDEQIEARRSSLRSTPEGEMPYDNYQPLDVIYNYIDKVAEQYPDVVTLVTPANSFEGYPIKYLKISSSNFEDPTKSVIFIESTIHAREWIAPPTATYAIHKLVENLTDPELLEKFDWIILPVANPDGYVFSFETSRFWRKTRSTEFSTSCPGVDGNRNFDFFWNTIGTSSNLCADNYAGGRPFSEVETRVVRDIIHEHLDRMVMYLSMHSYGSMILYSWGHDGSLSNQAFSLHSVGISMADAIYENSLPHFPRYSVGNSRLVVGYAASGISADYAHAVGVPLSYTYELPGFGGGFVGFHLNPRYIKQVAEETWEGIAVGAKRAGALFGNQ
ncbi:unnamed protein product [Leptidea sinapis]|uniref:Peptidase M14 domain-containing protein n=1 Tax=Leptidea sinapis TaxID=189913 RepID=A0A5E4QMD5_9NEOP|nr:unnamed protein product [Leptidea sinapis]